MSQIGDQDKETIKNEYGLHPSDAGGTEVQIALVTNRILSLNEHLKKVPKDKSSRRGLLKLVGQRRRLLNYLIRSKGRAEYQTLIKRLGLRK